MYKWAFCVSFIHTTQSFIVYLLIFAIILLIYTHYADQCVFCKKILYKLVESVKFRIN